MLELRTGYDKPDIDKTIEKLNQGLKVPFDSKRVLALSQWVETAKGVIRRYINRVTGHPEDRVIDFTSRTATTDHIVNRLLDFYDDALWVKNRTSTSTGFLSTSTEVMNMLIWEAKKRKLPYNIPEAVILYKQLSYIVNNNLGQFIYDKLDEVDIVEKNPNMKKAATGRITTSNPNIQGFINPMKKCIKAPEGWKIVSMDITGQETHILIYGVMRNKELTSAYERLKDPYKAFLEIAGLKQTPAMRSMVKVPVLGTINGMGLNSIKADLRSTYEELSPQEQKEIMDHGGPDRIGTTIYRLINNDLGYQEKIVIPLKSMQDGANERVGLFGTRLPINTKSSRYARDNQFKNGFVQVTAAEILSLSIDELYKRNLQDTIKFLVPIYDEVVLMVKDDGNLDEYVNEIEDIFKPRVDDWGRFRGKAYVSEYYEDGDPNNITTLEDLHRLILDDKGKEELEKLEIIIKDNPMISWIFE